MQSDMTRRLAIAELLQVPDTPDLRRGHRITVEGRPDRHRLITYFASVFVQTKLIEMEERQLSGRESASTDFASERRQGASLQPSNLPMTVPARVC